MTNRAIFDMAIHLLAESSVSSEVEDYAQRTPSLLRLCAADLATADEALRRSRGEDAPSVTSADFSLDAPFPLDRAFAACASYFLAAMLILEELPALSETLYRCYQERRPASAGGPPSAWQSESIKNRYGWV